jgi:hypothetical protein
VDLSVSLIENVRGKIGRRVRRRVIGGAIGWGSREVGVGGGNCWADVVW